MCLGIYLATNRKLAAMPWNSEQPGLSIGDLSPEEEPVRAQVSHRFVYYVGSHTQCGCGFVEDGAAAEQSRAALSSYIDALGPDAAVELFVCWDGGYRDVPQHSLELSAQELAGRLPWLGDRSFDDENALVVIRRPAA